MVREKFLRDTDGGKIYNDYLFLFRRCVTSQSVFNKNIALEKGY